VQNLYYIANSIYQFAYALPVFERLGGTFVVNSPKKLRQFQAFVRQKNYLNKGKEEDIPVVLVAREATAQLRGILFFLANSIQIDQDYTQAITVFHEHGTSDKLYEGGDPIAVKKLEKYDYILLSGPKNRFRLEEIGVNRKEERYISMGCLRFDKLLSGGFDRSRTEKDLGIFYPNRNTLLYAPTWQFGQGTFKRYAHKLVLFSKARYNLILRPHYHDRKYGYGLYMLTQCLAQQQVRYASPTDLIVKDTYACFSASDLLISDNSSVVYEYLIMGRPILLLENSFDQKHQMPEEMDIRKIAQVHKSGQSLQKSIDHAVETFDPQSYRKMLETCFYNVQGGASKVAHEFFQSIL
jgi:hypothetical protein